MFSKTVIDSDAFLDMPLSTQALYFHLSMRADDDGFVNNPIKIMRMINASKNDMDLLCAKRFVIAFDSGIIVIRHWRLHNYIQRDRYHATQYIDEKSQLTLTKNKTYEVNGYSMETKCIQPVSKMDTQVRLGKVRLELGKDNTIGANSKDSPPPEPAVIELILNDKSLYPITQSQIDEWKTLYPAVDVMQELRKMKGWLDANPTKRKTKRGILRFVNNWLAKEQDRGKNVKPTESEWKTL